MIFTGYFMTGCQQEEDIFTVESNETDGYLSLPKGFDLLSLSVEESQIYCTALSRMSLFYEDGIIKTKVTSGRQIHISEDLFASFNEAIRYSNQLKGIKLSTPRLKTGNIESPSTNDCAAHSIYNVLSSFGSSITFESVRSYLQDRYGTNGVPSNAINEAIQHYLTGTVITLTNNYIPPAGTRVIIVVPTEDGNGHAVNLYRCTDNGIAVYTDSSSPEPDGSSGAGFEDISNVLYAFAATGVK
jgi:hypothetical protein